MAFALGRAFQRERAAIDAGAPPSPFLAQLMREQHVLLSDRALPRPLQSVLSLPSESERAGVGTETAMRDRWLEILGSQEHDPQSSAPDRLIATSLLSFLERYDRSYEILSKEVESSPAAYKLMMRLASLERKRGRPDQELMWHERAFREARGDATRFEAGVTYVTSLIRIRPNDEAAVRSAALEVLQELQGEPDRLRGRTKGRLAVLDSRLRDWNSNGRHDAAIAAIRGRMSQICTGIATTDEGDQSCAGFLSGA